MSIGRILPTEAAAIMNVSPQFVRIAMQQGKLPIGTAVRMSSIWTYHISEKLLADYTGKDVEKEIEKIRECGQNRKGTTMKYIASFSGGKDSMATIILAHEHNEPLDVIIDEKVNGL